MGVVQPDGVDNFRVEDVFASVNRTSRKRQLVEQAIQEVKKDQPI